MGGMSVSRRIQAAVYMGVMLYALVFALTALVLVSSYGPVADPVVVTSRSSDIPVRLQAP
jgi:hypothetical protein